MARHPRNKSRTKNSRIDKRASRQTTSSTYSTGQAEQAAMSVVSYLNAGNEMAATTILEEALQKFPKHPDLLHLAGQLALSKGQQALGRSLVEQAVAAAPHVPLYHMTLGSVYIVDDAFDQALSEFRVALRLDPKSADAYINVGIALAKSGRYEEALTAMQNAERLDPSNSNVHLNLAICYLELGQSEQVAESIRRLEALVPTPSDEMLREIGNVHRRLGQFHDAKTFYRRSIDANPRNLRTWFALGDTLSRSGDFRGAEQALKQAAELGYPAKQISLARARVASNRGDLASARSYLLAAQEDSNEDEGMLLRIADLYSMIGDFNAQAACLRRVLTINPDSVAAFAGLAFVPGRKLDKAEVDKLRSIALDRSVDTETRLRVSFSLGNHYRYLEAFDESFVFYRLGNRLKGFYFDRHAYAAWIRETEKIFDQGFFAERADWGISTTFPMLIIGMPRSGTTLTEQILSSHPSVHGAGEYGSIEALASVADLPELDLYHHPEQALSLTRDVAGCHAEAYLARMKSLAADSQAVVTNKLPHNFEQLGLFSLLFPCAPVVHVKRDPRDTLLSIYTQDFASMHEYAYDLKALGQYYRLYERLTDHWLKVIPNPVYELHYEDLIADLPGKARELAAFAGLSWDPVMIRYHESERMVQTASKWQVRQKLYTSSVGRWKNYESHLQPMLDALGSIA
jgi:tetratricopeptide (TPR) repeat protein